ncbi:dihydrofolate reductase family protein [Streptomyces sp. NPDC019443]|uniref:dihydrofolate reductase family protein n=1 Tax=Streptomyces sp. NPDC019443 TaxID=3365061 RepID=UPI0037B1AD27
MAEHTTAQAACGTPPGPLEPLELLYEEAGQPCFGLPSALAAAYGGDLGFTPPCVYANFVASIDGVVALGPEYPSSGSAISGRKPADRFVMGLLRACADAVLIGAGTLRATPGHQWTPDHVCPQAAPDFAELRRSLRRATQPRLVVVTASGDVPTEHPRRTPADGMHDTHRRRRTHPPYDRRTRGHPHPGLHRRAHRGRTAPHRSSAR